MILLYINLIFFLANVIIYVNRYRYAAFIAECYTEEIRAFRNQCLDELTQKRKEAATCPPARPEFSEPG